MIVVVPDDDYKIDLSGCPLEGNEGVPTDDGAAADEDVPVYSEWHVRTLKRWMRTYWIAIALVALVAGFYCGMLFNEVWGMEVVAGDGAGRLVTP